MSEAGVSVKPRKWTRGSKSGRTRALALLDRLAAGKTSQRAIMAALEARFREDPVRFFRTVVMPLLPRDATLSAAGDDVVEWIQGGGVSKE